jgi:hypothetical protein
VALKYGLDVEGPGLWADSQGLLSGAETAAMEDLQAFRDQLGRAQETVPRDVRRAAATEAARSFAQSAGQAGAMPIGGGSSAAMRQTGLESGVATGRAMTELETSIMPQLMASRSGAAEKMGQMTLGAQERRSGAMINAMNRVAELVKENTDDWLGDDEQTIMRGVEALWKVETDPDTKAYLASEYSTWTANYESDLGFQVAKPLGWSTE